MSLFAQCRKLHSIQSLTRIPVKGTCLKRFHSSPRVRNTAEQKKLRSPRVVFSGIQPTGIPHLGNYLGALSNWVKLQKTAAPEDELLFSIVGWHALTLPQDPKTLSDSRMDMLATLLAIGIDPKRSILFHQDQNQNHTELAWILSCLAPMGKLQRMTTWKAKLAASRNANDESEVDESLLNVGLFTYPILQAADIMVYKATHIPVGEDQKQHLELAKNLADTFNRAYKAGVFPSPHLVTTPCCRILSLKDPTSKMSKSAPDTASRVLLTDTFSAISLKIKASVTDSLGPITYDPILRPGTSNLLTILAACVDEDVHSVAGRYEGKGHEALKGDVAEAIEKMIEGPRLEFERIRGERGYLEEVARDGALRARERSEETMREVRATVGLP
ncbi:hypothetical protein PILCRDRAFT_3829 [Piloderma croceum F 1598]|uniref:tryptophan--tRNA ligase n=1 Tax=Piloderma croceum (strain F 1598) TaxID=765440 RepID=A0A0C3CCD2_PILCF|nr:hypothetical protein PILCRDRAFT_3829 [Piloderma croceum F 1598]